MIVYIYNIGVDLYNGFNGLRHRINWTYFTVLDGLAHPLYSLKRESRGFSDFNYTRNRILWATRDNPSVRGIPKSNNEIKKNKGKKRGPYNKKK